MRGSSWEGASGESALETAAFYAGAWWLVHLLRNGPPEVTERFDRVVRAANGGENLSTAWDRVMVPSGYGEIERRFRDYLEGSDLELVRARFTPDPPQSPATRPLSDAETHLLWARLVSWKGPNGAQGLAQLDAASKRDPGSPEMLYWRGVSLYDRDDVRAALSSFEAAVERSKEEPRYLFGLALCRSKLFATSPSAVDLQAFTDTFARLEQTATSASELDLVAQYRDRTGARARAATLSTRSLAIDPSCAQCAITRARIAYEDGWLDDAVRLQKRAIGLLPDDLDDRMLTIDLKKYEAAAATKPSPSQ